ncbi:MAG: SppA protein [Hyphomonadaceae bacterium]|nr:SppA protein [Hyphomonadaceae bacterium]MBC6411778.1 SppA protein [Hyphomonadaceae bacterium]
MTKRKGDIVKEKAKSISNHYDADVYLFFGAMFYPYDKAFIDTIRQCKRARNALLILDTPGGTAEAAYRMGRAVQRAYKTKRDGENEGQFLIYVDEMCKSAGTILSLAADKIIISRYGELGPIDVQLRKDDEIGERTSGLTPHQALETLQLESGQHFKRFFRQLRFDDELGFSTKLSADIAAKMVVGLMGSVYGQMDPSRLGEVERHVRVSSEYGRRLATKNVKQETIEKLVSGYPSHGFVIDRTEARDLFESVELPTDELESVAHDYGDYKSIMNRGTVVTCLSREEEENVEHSDRTE